MASKNASSTGTVYLDTSSAQSALDKLNAKIKAYDAELTKTTTTAARRNTIEADRAKAAEKAASVQQQIEKGLGSTYSQQSKYLKELSSQLKNIAVGTDEYKQKLQQLKQAQGVFDEMKRKINGVEQAQEQMGNGFTRAFTRIAQYAAAYFAFDQVKSFLADSVEEAEAAEKALSRLQNTLNNVGRSDAFDRITAKADEFANTFKYLDNDDITEVFQQLITYGKLTESQMNQLLPVIIDFSAKSGISINEGASVVIKAMEGNAKALKEYGINIKEGSNVTERFGILMSDLKPKVEGAATAFGETFAGKAAIAKQEVANLKEEIGNKLLPVLSKFYQSTSYVIDGLKTIFTNTINFFDSAYNRAKLTIGLMKDLASLDPAGAAQRAAMFNLEKDQQAKTEQAEKDRLKLQAVVTSVVNDAAKTSLKDQQAALKANIALKEESFKVYNDLVSQGKKNTEEGHKAATQLATDAAVVIGLQKLIKQTKDTRVLGNGDPNADPQADKAAEAAAKKQEQQQQQLLKELKDFQFELSQVGHKADETEKDRIGKKYDELIAKAAKFHVSVLGLEKQKNTALSVLQAEELDAKRKIFDKQAEQDAKDEYQNQLAITAEYFDKLKDIEAKKYGDGLITKDDYDINIKNLDIGSNDERISIAKQYVDHVKDAEKDLFRFQKQARSENLKDAVTNAENIEKLQQQAALNRVAAEVTVAKEGSKRKLDAQKEQLKIEYDTEVKALKEKEKAELVAIENQYAEELKLLIEQLETKRKIELALVDPSDPAANQKKNGINSRYDTAEKSGKDEIDKRRNEAVASVTAAFASLAQSAFDTFTKKTTEENDNYWKSQVDKYQGYANQVLDIVGKLNDAKSARENAAFDKEVKQNDLRKKSIQKLADSHVISSQQAAARIAAIDEAQEKEKEELAQKQFDRNKRLQIAQTLINAAAAAIKLWIDPGFPTFIPMEIALAAQTAAQVALISSTKYGKGGVLNGPSHSDGGMPVINPRTGRKEAEVEGGEYILSKHTVRNNRELADQLLFSSMHRGGASVKPYWKSRPMETLNFPRAIAAMQYNKFASGGVFNRQAANSSGQQSPATDPAIAEALQQSQAVNMALLDTLDNLNAQLAAGITSTISQLQIEQGGQKRQRQIDLGTGVR